MRDDELTTAPAIPAQRPPAEQSVSMPDEQSVTAPEQDGGPVLGEPTIATPDRERGAPERDGGLLLDEPTIAAAKRESDAPARDSGSPLDEPTIAAPEQPGVGAVWIEPLGPSNVDAGRGWERGRARRIVAVVAILLVAFAALLVVVARNGQGERKSSGGGIQVMGSAAPSASEYHYAVADTPFDNAMMALKLHAGALLDGDEAGWMAAVDPRNSALVTRYRALYRVMRTMGVTRFAYTPGISVADRKNPGAFTIPVRADYCFGADTCAEGYPPSFNQALTMKLVGGKYVITAAVDKPDGKAAEPTPWQDGKLVLKQGRHVVVGADPSEASFLPTVLPVAERAAAADEPFATMLLAKQAKYRVYLAGERQWKTWFGGMDDWAVGYAMPISQSGYDVVLRIRDLKTAEELRVTLQHEFGHVITLTGSEMFLMRNQWLSEGIAEYIGWSPQHAKDSFRRSSVEWALGRKRLTSMIPAAPGANASLRQGDAYYGLSHFAVDCMAQKYGQANVFRFVRLVLLRNEDYDAAAREAYHQPFAKVDKFCTTWIRQNA